MSASNPKPVEHGRWHNRPARRHLSYAAGIAAVVLGAWSVWLASSQSLTSVTARIFAGTSDAAPAELPRDEDDEETLPRASRVSASGSTSAKDAIDTQVRRAVHVTMTGVTAESGDVHPAGFENHRSSSAPKNSPDESTADVWLTGTIEDSDDAAEPEERTFAAIPAWKRNSKPLKSRLAKRRDSASPDRH